MTVLQLLLGGRGGDDEENNSSSSYPGGGGRGQRRRRRGTKREDTTASRSTSGSCGDDGAPSTLASSSRSSSAPTLASFFVTTVSSSLLSSSSSSAAAASALTTSLLTVPLFTALLLLLWKNKKKRWSRRIPERTAPGDAGGEGNGGIRCNSTSDGDDDGDRPRVSLRCDRSNTSSSGVRERKSEFLRRFGDDYGYAASPGGFIDAWRPVELPRLLRPADEPSLPSSKESGAATGEPAEPHSMRNDEEEQEVYLDYAGSALPTRSQLRKIYYEQCCGGAQQQHLVLANPHSTGPAASRTTRRVEAAKKRVLDHFNAQPGRLYSAAAGCSPLSSPREDEDGNAYQQHHPGYDLVFTSGATQALQLVAERFPFMSTTTKAKASECEQCRAEPSSSSFSSGGVLVYPQESHTSVVGMRNPALARGGRFLCKPLDDIVRDIEQEKTNEWLGEKCGKTDTALTCPCHLKTDQVGSNNLNHLVVLPMECNFGGRRIAGLRSVIRRLQQITPTTGGKFWVMLDVAKASSTGEVDLRRLNPEFACFSAYKMFGEPTGLGCLFVRRDVIKSFLQQPSNDVSSGTDTLSYFGGGSVDVVLATENFAVRRSSSSSDSSTTSLASLSSGTIHFRGIVSLSAGFEELERVGGMKSIHRHAFSLAVELARRLRRLVHHNNSPVVELYGAWAEYFRRINSDIMAADFSSVQGPTVTFNIRRNDGSYVGYNEVSKLACLNRPPIQLRTGCFCNPGSCQLALGLSNKDILRNYQSTGHVCGDDVDIIDGRPTGAIRASFGKDSSFEDMDALVVFIERLFVSRRKDDSGTGAQVRWDGSPRKVVLSEIYLFPIKSCSAQRVKKWPLENGRMQFDREFALVDSSGTAMRLQTYPRMAFLQPGTTSCDTVVKLNGFCIYSGPLTRTNVSPVNWLCCRYSDRY